MKYDPSPERVYAFVKRILQLCIGMCPPPLICGFLILIARIEVQNQPFAKFLATRKNAAEKLTEGQKKMLDDDSEDEVYHDVLEEPKDDPSSNKVKEEEEGEQAGGANSQEEKTETHESKPEGEKTKVHSTEYDPLKRDPSFANATKEELWELALLTKHAHPSVAAIAKALLVSPESISYEGNPILDFSVIGFLDRFVYKNPKARDLQYNKEAPQNDEEKRANNKINVFSQQMLRASLIRPAANAGIAKLVKDGKSEDIVPVDEKFFYNYFTLRKEHDDAVTEHEPKRVTKEDDIMSSSDEDEDDEDDTLEKDAADEGSDKSGDEEGSDDPNGEKVGEFSYSDLDDDDFAEDFTARGFKDTIGSDGEEEFSTTKKHDKKGKRKSSDDNSDLEEEEQRQKRGKKAKKSTKHNAKLEDVDDDLFVGDELNDDQRMDDDGALDDSSRKLGLDEMSAILKSDGSKKKRRASGGKRLKAGSKRPKFEWTATRRYGTRDDLALY